MPQLFPMFPINKLLTALLILLFIYGQTPIKAGGGPENLVLVVNEDSWASLAIANEYISLRKLPPLCIVYCKNLPSHEEITIQEFREHILEPILETVEKRNIAKQIDYVIYSSDFPSAIDFSAEKQEKHTLASLTSLTYLYSFTRTPENLYSSLNNNWYAPIPFPKVYRQVFTSEEKELSRQMMQAWKQKRWIAVEEIISKLLVSHPESPQLLYNYACCLSKQKQYNESMTILKKAFVAGWVDHLHTSRDEDLKELRFRSDFQKLLRKMRETKKVFDIRSAKGFKNKYFWQADGKINTQDRGMRYLLSTMLGVTSNKANSVAEVILSLRRSREADSSFPQGTVYYMLNSNVRSQARQWGFASAIRKLKQLGQPGKIFPGILPTKQKSVVGLMAGSINFDWKKSYSTIAPGAICEHLTSSGGVFEEGNRQTPLTEFIRQGASGASGTVTEPYAIQAKFPNPFIHYFYRSGSNLAEAFYQSVRGPYQLLIVGDPLCAPWAKVPVVKVKGIQAKEKVKGTITIRPQAKVRKGKIPHYELYLDGRFQEECALHESFSIDTLLLEDGYHELRVVAFSDNDIQTQGRVIIPFEVQNKNHPHFILGKIPSHLAWGKEVSFSVKLPKASKIELRHNERILERILGNQGTISIPSHQLGIGNVSLQLIGTFFTGDKVFHPPLTIKIDPPPLILNQKYPDKFFKKGLQLTVKGKQKEQIIHETRSQNWLKNTGIGKYQSFILDGYFKINSSQLHQVQIKFDGFLELELNSQKIFSLSNKNWNFIPLSLSKGWHRLTVVARTEGDPQLQIKFGEKGTYSLSDKSFYHLSYPK